MYKLALCWKYLLTRYLALACVVSVMLGVATLIVVNSVMSGFSTKLRARLNSLLSDIDIESRYFSGFRDPKGRMDAINADPFLRERIEAMAPTMEVFAMLQYQHEGGMVARPVRLVAIETVSRSRVRGFAEFLVNQKNEREPSFKLSGEALRRYQENLALYPPEMRLPPQPPIGPDGKPPPDPPESTPHEQQGVILGWAIAHYRYRDEKNPKVFIEKETIKPGDEITLTTVSGQRLTPVYDNFVVCDYFKSEMSEYDANMVFVPLEHLQKLRTMEDHVTSIQIRLKDYRDAAAVVNHLQKMRYEDGFEMTDEAIDSLKNAKVPDEVLAKLDVLRDRHYENQAQFSGQLARVLTEEELKKHEDLILANAVHLEKFFPPHAFNIMTWEDKQGPLLGAIAIEKGLLNVLLFLIIAVAGFGILAIFSMIVTEKTRDIGILKALGASNGGVMSIFLGYGLLLGLVGAGLGTGLGLAITIYINEIEKGLTWLTGQQIFDRSIYYFNKIPTDIQPSAVLLVNLGSITIAVLFSVLPALRAALLHPVQALRYE